LSTKDEILKYRKYRKRRRAKIVLTVFVSTVLAAGIVVTLFFAPFFAAAEIYVTGNERVQENYIIARSGIRLGDNIFRISAQRMVLSISEIPYIREANIRRIFPNRMRIWVSENQPKANVAIGELFAIIDERGNVLEIQQDPYSIPIIRGLNVDGQSPGERITAHNAANLEIGINLLNEIIAGELSDSIISIDVTNLTRITMNFENRINITVDSGYELAYRMMFMRNILDTILPHEQGTLDMSLEHPYFQRTN